MKNKGITLVALVVTVVVLLILAGISVATLTGDNGMIGQAGEAKIETEKSEIKEQIDIMIVQSMDRIGNIDKEKLKEKLEKLPEGKEIIDGGDTIYVIYPKYSFEIDVATGDVAAVEIEKTTDETPWELAGDGSEDNPYLIESIEDLVAFSNNVNKGKNYSGKYVKLAKTLDFKSPLSYDNYKTKVSENETRIITQDENGTDIMTFLTTGTGFNPIGGETTGSFYGNFDGNGKTIKNIYINRQETYVGLFGCIVGTVEKLGLTGNIIGGKDYASYIGGLVGRGSTNATVRYCYNASDIKSNYGTIGGIVGLGCRIENCYNFGIISGTNSYGGISSSGEVIKNCYNYGKISGGENFVGGIASSGIVENCYNLGNVTGNKDYSYGIGGIVGTTQASIKNSYNKGKVSGSVVSTVGGVIGNYKESDDNGIENCYYLKGTAEGGIANNDVEGKGMPLEEFEMPSVIEVVSTGNEQIEYNGKMVDIWKEDTNNINNGYPILYWQ